LAALATGQRHDVKQIPYMSLAPPPVRWDGSKRSPFVPPPLLPDEPTSWPPRIPAPSSTTPLSPSDDEWGAFTSASPSPPPQLGTHSCAHTIPSN
jgi:hypothetical protein